MERGVLLEPDHGVDAAESGRRIEDLGYDAVWSPELWGADAVVRMAEIAVVTEALALGTAIVNVFSRTPAVLAMAAASLQRVSNGRFTLGFGVSTPKAVEDLHGMEYENPVGRASETIDLVTQFTSGEGAVDYDGETFSVADFPALGVEVPVYYAALGPANRRVVGRACDGWIPHLVPFSRLESSFSVVADAAQEANRNPHDISVAPYVPVAVSDDPEEARSALAGHVAYYVGSGEGYRKAVGSEFPDGADAVAEAWREGDRGAAREAVTDEMITDLGVAGTPETAEKRLTELGAETPIDHAILVVPVGSSDELRERTLEALAPS
jgi:alkanesulfonate monooxygenase SsuD/methylene tetrahydromethanopterin reductase-like flavin-dependent oxidoreductase (luciferase family)